MVRVAGPTSANTEVPCQPPAPAKARDTNLGLGETTSKRLLTPTYQPCLPHRPTPAVFIEIQHFC